MLRGLGEEVELGEVGDERPVGRGLEREVEVVERLDRREAGRLHPGRAAVAVPGAHLLGEHRGEIGLVVPALVPGPVREPARHVPDARRLERPARKASSAATGAVMPAPPRARHSGRGRPPATRRRRDRAGRGPPGRAAWPGRAPGRAPRPRARSSGRGPRSAVPRRQVDRGRRDPRGDQAVGIGGRHRVVGGERPAASP